MEFIDGDQRALASASLDDVERLGQATASVHNLPVDNVADFFPGPNRLAAYAQERLELNAGYLPRLRDPLPADVRSRLDRAFSQVAAAAEWAARAGMFTAEEPLALLHGDAADGNIFWSKQPVLIDWEYARLGDPADEVAYIFGQHALNGAQRSAFWRGYRRTSHARHLDQVVERAKWWEPVLLLGSSLWWLERWSRRVDADAAGEIDPAAPKPPEYYLEHASRRLDRLLATGPNAE